MGVFELWFQITGYDTEIDPVLNAELLAVGLHWFIANLVSSFQLHVSLLLNQIFHTSSGYKAELTGSAGGKFCSVNVNSKFFFSFHYRERVTS